MDAKLQQDTILDLYAKGTSSTQIAGDLHLPYSKVLEVLEDNGVRMSKDELERQIKELYKRSYPISQIARHTRCTFNRVKQVISETDEMIQSDGHKTLPNRSNDMIYALENSGYSADEIADKLSINKTEVLHVINKVQ